MDDSQDGFNFGLEEFFKEYTTPVSHHSLAQETEPPPALYRACQEHRSCYICGLNKATLECRLSTIPICGPCMIYYIADDSVATF